MNANSSELKKKIFIRFMMAPIFMGLMLFLPAGTLDYWQAWLYCAVLFIPMIFVVFYWSNVPVALVIAANAFVLSGYIFIFFVLRENSYASRIIEVESGQKVITTGPYAIVRHPMYLVTSAVSI